MWKEARLTYELGVGQGSRSQCGYQNAEKLGTETNGKLPPSVLLGTEQLCSEQVL